DELLQLRELRLHRRRFFLRLLFVRREAHIVRVDVAQVDGLVFADAVIVDRHGRDSTMHSPNRQACNDAACSLCATRDSACASSARTGSVTVKQAPRPGPSLSAVMSP